MANVTIIAVPTENSRFQIPGLWTEADVKSTYASELRGIATMTATVSDATGADGVTRTITFKPAVGQKG